MPTCRLSPEMEAKIMATPGVTVNGQPATKAKRTKKPKTLVQSGVGYGGGVLVIMVAVDTVSEINHRQWQARNRRTGQSWMAVRRAVGPYLDMLARFSRLYHDGNRLQVTFTRLGRLADLSNTASAVKGVEDAVAYLLGADDGDERWVPRFEREKSVECGVRVEIEVMHAKV